MHCIYCGFEIPNDSKFCQSCGKKLPKDLQKEEVKEITNENFCDTCGISTFTIKSEFYANIGMLLARRQMNIGGNMCENCTKKYFWKFTFINLFLGWWGIISFFATFLFIIKNTFDFISSLIKFRKIKNHGR